MIKLSLPAWARLPRQPMLRHLIFFAVGALFFFLLSNSLSDFNNFEFGEVAVYAIAIGGLSVLTGVNGQISLGQGAFVAVGAYTLAELQTHQSLNLVVELLLAVVVSGAVGLILAVPATRLRGPYLAGMTLLLALSLPFLSDKYYDFFGGDQGLVTVPPSAPGSIDPQKWLTWIELFCALVVMVLLANLLSSRFGRSFRAVRDNEVAASLAGIHVARTKVIAFVVSSACAGLAGALLALSTGVVSTGEFPLSLSIFILAGMVLGGTGTLTGAWWGAILVVFLPNQWAQSIAGDFNLNHLVAANLAVIIFGAVLVIVTLVAPAGIQGGLRWGWRRLVTLSTGSQLTGNISVPLQDQAVPKRGDSESDRATTSVD